MTPRIRPPADYAERLSDAAAEGHDPQECRRLAGQCQPIPRMQEEDEQDAFPVALSRFEWPDQFTIEIPAKWAESASDLERGKAWWAFLAIGTEASKRGYVWETEEDRARLVYRHTFTRRCPLCRCAPCECEEEEA